MLRASTEVNVRIRSGGERTLLFALSHYLKIDALEADGQPVDFIQNPAGEGAQRQRKGDDLAAVRLAAPLGPGAQCALALLCGVEALVGSDHRSVTVCPD